MPSRKCRSSGKCRAFFFVTFFLFCISRAWSGLISRITWDQRQTLGHPCDPDFQNFGDNFFALFSSALGRLVITFKNVLIIRLKWISCAAGLMLSRGLWALVDGRYCSGGGTGFLSRCSLADISRDNSNTPKINRTNKIRSFRTISNIFLSQSVQI